MEKMFLILAWIRRALTGGERGRFSSLFGNHYLNCNYLYLQHFKRIPQVTYIDGVDVTKCYAFIRSMDELKIIETFQTCSYVRDKEGQEFSKTALITDNGLILELAYQYVQIYFPLRLHSLVDKLLRELNEFRIPVKEKPFEINILVHTTDGLTLKSLETKAVNLDVGLYYNDEFREVDELIRTRLAGEHEKGIILLHGAPGTGKTTYLRYLIGCLKKKVIFVSPAVAGNLMNPELVDILIDNPNSVLVIEDAENIIMDRKFNSGSSVSNLLNLSDGLLSDCLNVQVICTFNSPLTMVDNALLRKGRLIARYEFGKLTVAKSQKLSDHLGFTSVVSRPMTVAEIAHQGEKDYEAVGRTETVGFRQREAEKVSIAEVRIKVAEMEQ
jgi:hypothetical protein